MKLDEVVPLVIWHIGGDGPIGPADAILKVHPETKIITFDARPEVGLPMCFSDREGEADFYIMQNPMASSLLRPAAQDEQVLWDDGDARGPHADAWRDVAKVMSTERVRTTTVDLHAASVGSTPDVLSIDTQGAETRILAGAVKTLDSVLAVISEVEFWPIYEGQGLFSDQQNMLAAHGFRLARLVMPQYWHPGSPSGDGFFTVAEAIWLRYSGHEDLSATQLCKLALIASAFNVTSYGIKLLDLAKKKMGAA